MTIESSEIQLAVGDRTTRAHLAVPSGAGPCPGVVVVQEWWGLNDHIRQVTNRFAEAGFVALAPDLYFGETATEPDEARKLVMAMQWDEALNVIQSGMNHLLAMSQVSPKAIGLTGFCMGGGLVWHGAAKLAGVGACVPFYGGGPEMSPEEVAQISAPILAIFGELDRGGDAGSSRMKRSAMMSAAGIPHETIIYPDAEHAFFNDTRPVYDAEAADDAWRRMIDLFRETLV